MTSNIPAASMAVAFATENLWTQAVGEFTLGFAAVEDLTHTCVEYFFDEDVEQATVKLDFPARIDLVIAGLHKFARRKPMATKRAAQTLIDLLRQAKQKGSIRNDLLHNPSQLQAYRTAAGEAAYERMIRPRRRPKAMYRLKDVQRLAHEMTDMAAALWKALYEVMETVPLLPPAPS